jgi:signal transduction histidine kinase
VAQNAQVTHRNLLPGICIGSHFSNFLSPMLDDRALLAMKEDVFALLEQGSGDDPETRARSIIVELNKASSKKSTQYLLFKLSKCQWPSSEEQNGIAHILLVVSNVDEQIETQRTLEASMRLQKTRPKQVVDAFYVAPSEVRRFLARSKVAEVELRRILSGKESDPSAHSTPITSIGRIAKSVLEAAQAMELELFVDAWTSFADIQRHTKVKKTLDERTLMRMLAKLDDIQMIRKLLEGMIPMMTAAHLYRGQFGDTDDIKDLGHIEQMSHDLVDAYASFSESFSTEEALTSDNEGKVEKDHVHQSEETNLKDHFTVYAQSVAAREGKKMELFLKGFDSLDSNHQYFALLSKVGSELLSNSIEHGLEIELNRILTHKERLGRVDVELSYVDDKLCMSVRDDGKGLDFVGIRTAAVNSGLIGGTMDDVDRGTLLRCIFENGLSTLQNQDGKLPRGEGLSRVKVLVKSAGGKVSVRSVDGQYCQFKIVLPSI